MSPLALFLDVVDTAEDGSFLENLIGTSIPGYAIWAGVGLVVALIIIFIAVGFFKELKKK